MILSQGTHHQLIPKDFRKNVYFRLYLLRRAAESAESAEVRRAILTLCKEDILFFINLFVVQYNAMKPPGKKVGPFITWGFQERALLCRQPDRRGILWCYENNRTAVVEKSRDLGASWLFLIFQDWLCLFFDHSQCLDISRDADSVDCKSPDSLFWKIRFMHSHLPDWLTGPINHQKMYIGVDRSKGVITGEASTSAAGVGGRAAVIFVDEFPRIKEDTAVRQGTANTSNCRFFNGTHLGLGTEFYQMTIAPEIIKIVMHWTQHPDKNKGLYSYDTVECKMHFWKYDDETDELVETECQYDYGPDYKFVMDGRPWGGPRPGIRSPWYDQKCDDIGSDQGVSMELDINPRGASKQFFDSLVVHHLKQNYCCDPKWEGNVVTDQNGYLVELVETPGGPLKLWIEMNDAGKPPVGFYGAGADCSGGVGTTPSCLTIIDGKTGHKVLEYANAHVEPWDFALVTAALCRLFSDEYSTAAKLVHEHRGPGINFYKKLVEVGFTSFMELVDTERTSQRLGRIKTRKIGWNPEGMAKQTLLREYMRALKTGEMLNPSERALDEMLAFEYDSRGMVIHPGERGNDPAEARENHGDRVIADALSWKTVKEEGKLSADKKRMKDRMNEDRPDPRTFEGRFKIAEMEEQLEERWA